MKVILIFYLRNPLPFLAILSPITVLCSVCVSFDPFVCDLRYKDGKSAKSKEKEAKNTTIKECQEIQRCDENPGPSKMRIGDVSGDFSVNRENSASGIIVMGLAVLFGVFSKVLKCPECDDNMTSHVGLKKHGFAHYILLQCDSLECE